MTTFSDLHILYLEDEVLISLDGEEVLEEIGCENVHIASSLQEAEAVVDTKKLDLAILDIHVGRNQSSIALAKRLREQGVKVMFTTGYNRNELPGGLESFTIVEKPLQTGALEKAVRTELSHDE